MLTQREIVAAYFEGRDTAPIIRRRVMLLQTAAIIATALALAVCLYVAKSAAGVDLFAFHLQDLF